MTAASGKVRYLDPLDSAVLEIVKGMGAALPADFRRTGRKWVRSSGVLSQEVGLRRLMSSYGTSVAELRIVVSDGTVRSMSGCDWIGHYWYHERPERWSGPEEWRIRADSDSSEISRIISEVRVALGLVVEYLDEQYTEDGYLQSLAARGNDLPVFDACIAFGRGDELRRMLVDPGFRPVSTADTREFDLVLAQSVLDAYTLLGDVPDDEWLDFCSKVVRLFRGRPPKQLRSMWEAVRGEVELRSS